MKNYISKELFNLVRKLYGKEFNYIFLYAMNVIAFDEQRRIKEAITSIKANDVDIATECAEAIQRQIRTCENYLKFSRNEKDRVKWTRAIDSQLLILDKIIDYLDSKSNS